ncbi:MAG: FAD-binding protein [Acidobacteriia bacterium]|nr:FAD-binding protein [Terriglobia bacterium]
MQEFAAELRPDFSGEIRTDRFSRLLYSTDASIYQIEPLAVLVPRGHDDVAAAVSLAARHRLPLLPRGSGTSLAGQTVGSAVVIDFSKYMNRILDANFEERSVRVEPGVILDQLNAFLQKSGWRYPPDVATSNRATIGGMIGNNSSGSHSILYGITQDHVRRTRVLLATGEEAGFGELSLQEWERRAALDTYEGRIYRSVSRLVAENRDEILARYPKIMRRVGGYNLDSVLDARGGNLSRLIVGSEGTLATCTETVLNLTREPRAKGLDIVHFSDLIAALEALDEILALQPSAVELIDKMLLDLTRLQPAFARKMTFVQGNPDAILIVEFFGETDEEVESKFARLEQRLRTSGRGTMFIRSLHPDDQANVWAIRKAGLGLLSSMRGDAKPISFVEDTAVAPELLSEYVRRFRQILQRFDARAGYYGHASVGCLHIKPIINLKETAGVRKMLDISAAVKDLVVEFKGAMSAEHGDGIARSQWNRELFGERLYAAFRQLKEAFDPAGIMNPGKIVDAPPMTSHLRYGPPYAAVKVGTHLDFSRDGGLVRAVEQCNGMGVCRKLDTGTMCPSYMATLEEEHSTRGRANALRAALSGILPFEEYAGDRIAEALDLCLACKACKTECPANVDMAKLKYEFLAGYNRSHGIALRSLLFGNIAVLSRLGSATAPLSNWLMRAPIVRRTAQRLMGIHPERRVPPFVRRTFRRWLRRHPPRVPAQGAPKVVLFNDTFTNYNEPWIGIAALQVLESAGAQVLVPEVSCCGRPMISKGLLNEAKDNARANVAVLAPFIESGAFVVGCEPSCILTLRDEYPDLLGTPEAQKLAGRTLSLEEYLCGRMDAGEWRPQFSAAPRTVLLHGHCHQKSLVGSGPSLRLLKAPPGFAAEEVDSGCCGMAGAFGYEKEHYQISLQIGEMRLFPAIRRSPADALIVASGTSCRQQILHATGRKALHLAEALARALVLGESGG